MHPLILVFVTVKKELRYEVILLSVNNCSFGGRFFSFGSSRSNGKGESESERMEAVGVVKAISNRVGVGSGVSPEKIE